MRWLRAVKTPVSLMVVLKRVAFFTLIPKSGRVDTCCTSPGRKKKRKKEEKKASNSTTDLRCLAHRVLVYLKRVSRLITHSRTITLSWTAMQLSLAIDARFYRCDVAPVSFFFLFFFASFSVFLFFIRSTGIKLRVVNRPINRGQHRQTPIDFLSSYRYTYILLSILRRGEPCSPCTKINFSCCR